MAELFNAWTDSPSAFVGLSRGLYCARDTSIYTRSKESSRDPDNRTSWAKLGTIGQSACSVCKLVLFPDRATPSRFANLAAVASMSTSNTDSADLQITGDTLALDPQVRDRIEGESEQLRKRYPSTALSLRVEICELFNPAHGHRVRCELTAQLSGRRQVLVRETQKAASAAIRGAFCAAKRQLSRPGTRSIKPSTLRSGDLSRIAG